MRVLQWLVIGLTATMILGVIAVVTVFVTRFPGSRPAADLPGRIELPEGATARAFTQGSDWIAVVTGDDRILIYDRDGRTLRQTIIID